MRRWLAIVGAAMLGVALQAAGAAHAQSASLGRWQVVPVPESPGSCSARLNGADIDLIVLINKNDKLVLVAGHRSWNAMGSVATTMAIDGGRPGKLAADGVGPLYMALIDDTRTAALRKAQTVDWTLPSGRFHVSVEGLGAAMDAVRTCEHAQPQPGG
jgi:hypothetical protein